MNIYKYKPEMEENERIFFQIFFFIFYEEKHYKDSKCEVEKKEREKRKPKFETKGENIK